MAERKARRNLKTDSDGEVRNKCVEPIIKFNDEERLINYLSWIKFKIVKKMFTPEEISEMLIILADKSQV